MKKKSNMSWSGGETVFWIYMPKRLQLTARRYWEVNCSVYIDYVAQFQFYFSSESLLHYRTGHVR